MGREDAEIEFANAIAGNGEWGTGNGEWGTGNGNDPVAVWLVAAKGCREKDIAAIMKALADEGECESP